MEKEKNCQNFESQSNKKIPVSNPDSFSTCYVFHPYS